VETDVFGDQDSINKFKLSISDDQNNILVEIVTSDYENALIGWTEYKCTLSDIKKNSISDKL